MLIIKEARVYSEDDKIRLHIVDENLDIYGSDIPSAIEKAVRDLRAYYTSENPEAFEALKALDYNEVLQFKLATVFIALDIDESRVGNDEFISVSQAAEMLHISKPRIYAMVNNGVLVSRKIGHSVLVSKHSVQDRLSNPRHAGRPRKL